MSARNSATAKRARRQQREQRKAAFGATRGSATYGVVNAIYRAFWGV